MKTSIGEAKGFVQKSVTHEIAMFRAREKDPTLKAVHMPIYLHSSPGIGKSAVVLQVCNELDIGFEDIRLAQMEQSDVQGIPYVSHDESDVTGTQTMKLSIPEWFPSKERIEAGEFKEEGVLFFDEMSNAPIPVQQAAYRIVLDRELHRGVELGEGWVIVSAGNMKSDKTGAKGVAPALANRYAMHFEIEANNTDFNLYAIQQGLNEQILGFLSFNTSMLYKFDPKKSDVSFASPRSWEQISNLLDVGYNDDELARIVSACIGDGAASEFMSFRKYYGQLPDLNKIMAGEATYKIPNDNGIKFALSSSIIFCLIENAQDSAKVKNLDKVLMSKMPDDFLIMIYKNIKGVFEKQSNDDAEKSIANILMNTSSTFHTIAGYVGNGDIEA